MNIKNNLALSFVLASFLLITAPASAKKADKVPETLIEDSEIEIHDDAVFGATVETVSTSTTETGESVLPTTDNESSVLNKKIKFAKRFQLDLSSGLLPDEVIVNNSYSLIRVSYYTNEEYSFGVGFRSRYGGKTSFSKQFYEGSSQLEFDRAPAPKEAYFVSYGFNFYYGKISLAKNIALPASTKLEFDFGMQSFDALNLQDSKLPLIQTALNQSFFIGSHLSLGMSLGLSAAQIIDPTSVDVRLSQPLPNEQSFATKIQFNQYVSLNLNLLL